MGKKQLDKNNRSIYLEAQTNSQTKSMTILGRLMRRNGTSVRRTRTSSSSTLCRKWHMGGKDGLMYRNPSTNRGEVPSGTDDYFCNNCYFQRTVKIPVCKCRAGVCSNNKLHKTEAECNKEPGNKEPGCTWATKWIQFQWFSKAGRLDKNHPKGPKPHFAEGKKDATKPIRVS